jgi:predicted nucleic acid-binding protein
MRTFVDTSALYALLDEDDRNHSAAAAWFKTADAAEVLVTHNYVVVETAALVQRRLGAAAVRALFDALIPAMSVMYVDDVLHSRAVAAFLAGLRRHVSFVDWVSFQLVRDAGLDRAFAFDADFAREGFVVVPHG